MIIYEVSFLERGRIEKQFYPPIPIHHKDSVYFSNNVKAKSFVSKNKNIISDVEIIKHDIGNSKTCVIKFLNRNTIG